MTWNVAIRNIAGIREGRTTIERGVNAVRANNWRGKSSLLAAIETAMGTETPLTEGQETGRVELETETERYAVELIREGETIVRRGDTYLTEESDLVAASLYAFLDTTNEVRSAVREGKNLADVLTRPLDFENIDERIADRKREREQVEAELEAAAEAAERLPDVEERVTRLVEEREELRERRAELKAGDTADDDVESTREKLSDARATREKLQQRIRRLEKTIDRTEERVADRRAELDELSVPENEEVAERLAEAREAQSERSRDAELLQSVYAANKRVLEEERLELITDVERGLMDDTVTCWVCGSEAEHDDFSSKLDALAGRIEALRSEAAKYESRVEALTAERDEIERAERRRADLVDEIAELETTVADRKESLKRDRERLAEVETQIETLSERIADADERLTDVESEIKYVEAELDDAREELRSLESRANERETLDAEYESLSQEITQLRNRKDEIRRRTREAFDEAIREILGRFDTSFETARLTSQFDLVVARNGREASLDALSEGELEILGIVAALAGHEAFSVSERVPMLLLDGLGGLAEQNLRELIQYLDGRAQYLVFTAYPEHETFTGHEIDPEEWSVVSDTSKVRANGQ